MSGITRHRLFKLVQSGLYCVLLGPAGHRGIVMYKTSRSNSSSGAMEYHQDTKFQIS